METNIKSNELELMRSQIDILKRKLSDQTIINDKLMRLAMRKRMDWIKKYVVAEIISIPVIAVFALIVHNEFGLSASGLILLMIGCVIDVFMDYKINCMKPSDWTNHSLVDIAMRLTKMKRLRNIQTAVSIVLLIAVLGWIVVDSNLPADMDRLLTGSVIIGGIAGFIAAFLIVIKMNKTSDEIVKEINEITNSEQNKV